MGAGWIVAVVAVFAAVVASVAARRRCRALRVELSEQSMRHELVAARLRGELTAAVADAARARGEGDAARASVSSALLETGRLQQQLREVRAAMVERSEHDRIVAAHAALQVEHDGLRAELRTLEPVASELAAHRGYVESLQRELLYRDEQLLVLEDSAEALTAGASPGRAATGEDRPGVEPEAAEVVIDLTDGSGQRGQGRGVEPGVEEVVEGSARHG